MSESASSIYEDVNSMHIFYHCKARICVGGVCVNAMKKGGEGGFVISPQYKNVNNAYNLPFSTKQD